MQVTDPPIYLSLLAFSSSLLLVLVRFFLFPPPKLDEDKALSDHLVVPLSVRIAVPLLLATTLALFVFSNSTVGASVSLKISVAKNPVVDLTLFDFSLLNTIREMWHADVYALSLLVAVWSGIWPYIKILLMFFAWYTPPAFLPRPHRRRLLLMMDVLGKWALVDLFLMNMMEVAFRFHLSTMHILADVHVTPQVGLFSFVTAVAFSIGANTLILGYHRNATHVLDDDSLGARPPQMRDADDVTLNESLLWSYPDETDAFGFCPRDSWFERGTVQALNTRDHTIVAAAEAHVKVSSLSFTPGALPWFLVDERRKLKPWVWKLVLLSLFLSVALTLVAANIDAFEFSYTGVAGELIGLVDEAETKRRCSLITIARELSHASDNAPFAGILYQQVLYILFSLVFPLLVSIVAFCLITFKLNLFELKVAFYALEIGMANASLDVFIVAIIAAVLQVDQFSQFLQAPVCDPLRKVVPDLRTCFAVETQLLPGCWLVVAAAGVFWLVIQFIQRVVERAVAERERHVLLLCDESAVGCRVRCV